jgi:hypothetical protein
MEHDAADRSRYQLAIDQDSSTPINFAESINFSPFQKIRTHRRFDAQPLDLSEYSAESVGNGFSANQMLERVRNSNRRWICQQPDQHEGDSSSSSRS